MEPQDTLLCLQKLATGLCCKADQCPVPCNFKEYLNIEYYLCIYAYVSQVVSSLEDYLTL
jgi:hypothetical protein